MGPWGRGVQFDSHSSEPGKLLSATHYKYFATLAQGRDWAGLGGRALSRTRDCDGFVGLARYNVGEAGTGLTGAGEYSERRTSQQEGMTLGGVEGGMAVYRRLIAVVTRG